MTVVAYMTHPIGERDTMFERRENIANSADWFKFLKDTTQWAIDAPWFGYLAAVDSDFYRRSWLTDQCEIMSRTDVLVLVGGRVSPHMRILVAHATGRSAGRRVPVLDLIDLGRLVPWRRKDEVGKDILRRAEHIGIDL